MSGNDQASLLHIEHLSVSYRRRPGRLYAVNDVCLSVQPGESVGLVGESGCGKSTVALALMRFLSPNGRIDRGRILFQGRDLLSLSPRAMRRVRGAGIAMLTQHPASALNPSLKLGTQLLEVRRWQQGERRPRALARLHQLLQELHLTEIDRLLAAYPHQLSGGQQQRLGLAMALLAEPALLVLDEPTSALDSTVAASLTPVLRSLRQTSGLSLLYISHDLGRVLDVCDRVLVMYAGQIIEAGPLPDVFTHPRHPYTHGLFQALPGPQRQRHSHPLQPVRGQMPVVSQVPQACTFAPRCAAFQPGLCDNGVPPLRDPETPQGHHPVRCQRWPEALQEPGHLSVQPAPPLIPGDTVLHITGLRKYYPLPGRLWRALSGRRHAPCTPALESVNLTLHRHEIVALVGESGSGKSTLGKIVAGLETATAGTVQLQGEEVAQLPVTRRTAAQQRAVQMIFQHSQETLNPSLSIGSQIARALQRAGRGPTRLARQHLVQHLLERVQLPPELVSQRPHTLSGGQQQRVAIARAFASQPALIVADEPVTALDISVQAAVLALLLDIQRTQGTAILFISHDLHVVQYLADQVVVLYRGQVLEYGPAAAVFAPPYHPYTEALLAARPGQRATGIQPPPASASPALPAHAPPTGCPFVARCPYQRAPLCTDTPPPLRQITPGHMIACHLPLTAIDTDTTA
ncbi:MAG: ABC transporter ATP-binding protein [Candidatus Tectimicrobiota bacterium]